MVRLAKQKRWPRMRALALRKIRSREKAGRCASSRRQSVSRRGVVGERGEVLVVSGMRTASLGFYGSWWSHKTVTEAVLFRYAFLKNAKLQHSRESGNPRGVEDVGSCGVALLFTRTRYQYVASKTVPAYPRAHDHSIRLYVGVLAQR